MFINIRIPNVSNLHGCKADYYLLSGSAHSDVRWRDDRRRGPVVYFSEAATNKLLPQDYDRDERRRITDTVSYLYTKVELLGRNSSTRTRCESISVPQDNPLDTRSQ